MTVKIDVPNFENLIDKATERTARRALIEVENEARLTAPVDTGFYRNNIRRDVENLQVVANAEYSAPIEYGVGGTARKPNPVMRNAGRKVQKDVVNIFLREFKKIV